MNGFTFRAGRFGDCLNFLINAFFNAHLRQRNRQPDGMAEVQHRFDLFHRAILQHQLRQGTKRHFLAMVQMVALFEDGETVVNGVRGGQTATFKADTAEVGIRSTMRSSASVTTPAWAARRAFSPSASSVS